MNLNFIQKITIDLTIDRLQNVYCSQDDNDSRTIIIIISDNGKPYTLSKDISIYLKIKKPQNNGYVYIDEEDSEHLYRNSDGTITLVLSKIATDTHGIANAELQLFDKNNKIVVSTRSFNIVIKRSVLSNDDIIAKNDSNVIEDMIYHLTDYNNPHRIPEVPDSLKNPKAISLNGKSYDGSSAVDVGTLGVKYGGTGEITANAAANSFINSLTTDTSVPTDSDYYVSQYVNGGTTVTTYHRKPTSTLWTYIKSKISNEYVAQESHFANMFYSMFAPYFIYSEDAGDIITSNSRGGTRASGEPAFYCVFNNCSTSYPYCGCIIGMTRESVTLTNLTSYGTNTISQTKDGYYINRINTSGQWSSNTGIKVQKSDGTELFTNAVFKMVPESLSSCMVSDIFKSLIYCNKSLSTSEKGNVFKAVNEVLSKLSDYALTSHTHSYLPLTGGTLSGNLIVGGKVRAWTDNEGGNLEIESPDGVKVQMDVNGNIFRIYIQKSDGSLVFPFYINPSDGYVSIPYLRSTGKISANKLSIGNVIVNEDGDFQHASNNKEEGWGILNNAGQVKFGVTYEDGTVFAGNAIIIPDSNAQIFYFGGAGNANKQYPMLKITQFTNSLQILPTQSNTCTIGHTEIPLEAVTAKNIYNSSGLITSSDRNKKKDFADITAKFAEQIIDGLIPTSFKYRDGDSGRTHYGLIAQDVEKLLEEFGIDSKDFAPLVKNYPTKEVENEDGSVSLETDYDAEPEYFLRYEGFIGLIIKYIQGLKQENEELKNIMDCLDKRLSVLENNLSTDYFSNKQI